MLSLPIAGPDEKAGARLGVQMSLSSHSAPATSAAFTFQLERALYWLARSPAGFQIGIETDDDVAILGSDASLLLEQDKHSVAELGHPFGDRSRGLWNTLATWLDALDSAEVESTTRFLMVTNKNVPACLARQINDAISEVQIDECVAALEEAAIDPPAGLAPLMELVMRPSRRASLRTLIANCELSDGNQCTAGAALRQETIAHLQLPQWSLTMVDSIVDELLGWLHRAASEMWQQRVPAWIARDSFINQMHAVLRQRFRQITRERAERLIPVSDETVGQSKGSTFVKQIYLVTDDDDVVDASIREFIRCGIEKTRLSIDGNVTDDDWLEFEATLLARWRRIRARVTRLKSGTAERDVGFEILMDTTEQHREMLAGSATEQVYLTSGSYHRLADALRVGWHPQFDVLLRKIVES